MLTFSYLLFQDIESLRANTKELEFVRRRVQEMEHRYANENAARDNKEKTFNEVRVCK